jgi:hypothetical protein
LYSVDSWDELRVELKSMNSILQQLSFHSIKLFMDIDNTLQDFQDPYFNLPWNKIDHLIVSSNQNKDWGALSYAIIDNTSDPHETTFRELSNLFRFESLQIKRKSSLGIFACNSRNVTNSGFPDMLMIVAMNKSAYHVRESKLLPYLLGMYYNLRSSIVRFNYRSRQSELEAKAKEMTIQNQSLAHIEQFRILFDTNKQQKVDSLQENQVYQQVATSCAFTSGIFAATVIYQEMNKEHSHFSSVVQFVEISTWSSTNVNKREYTDVNNFLIRFFWKLKDRESMYIDELEEDELELFVLFEYPVPQALAGFPSLGPIGI